MIDEFNLDATLRKNGLEPDQFKKTLQQLIEINITVGKATDLLWICDAAKISPHDAVSLYHLVFDKIPETVEKKTKGKPNLSTESLDQLTLTEEQFEPLIKGYRLNIDPEYKFRFLMTSDSHLGSEFDNIEGLEKMFDYAVDVGARAIFHAGDLTNGAFAHRDMYLTLRDGCQTFEGQYERAVKYWPKRKEITTYFIAGNHDHFFLTNAGVDICKHISLAREDMVYLKNDTISEIMGRKGVLPEKFVELLKNKELGSGQVGAIRIGPYHLSPAKRDTILMLMHPGDGSSQALSYKPQKIMTTLKGLIESFENMQSPQGKRIKPHILGIGHYHKTDVNFLRNVYVFQAGTMSLKGHFQERKNLSNMMGYWVIEANTKKNGDILKLENHFKKPYIPSTRYTRTVINMRE